MPLTAGSLAIAALLIIEGSAGEDMSGANPMIIYTAFSYALAWL